MKVLLDTNAYTALLRGDESVGLLLESADVVYLSAVVVGELLFGFRGGTREASNRKILRDFMVSGGKTVFLPVSWDTAERFALIKQNLEKKGTPIPLNDVWIAAQCQETGAVLASFDTHFDTVEGILRWK
jgi:tRNA(fMet)-specific endonuclease VapC